jgi:hypothetical protein
MNIRYSGLPMPLAAMFAAAILLCSAGCAKIADVQPPEIHIPKPATGLIARQVSDRILLSVPLPAQNTDGSPAGTLHRVDVYRFPAGAPADSGKPLSDAALLKQTGPILSIPATDFARYLRDGAFLIEDKIKLPSDSPICCDELLYAVVFVNNKNRNAGLSNRAGIIPIPIPPPPDGLSAAVKEHAIQLKWNAPLQNTDGSKPPRIAGYDLYRSETKDRFEAKPINSSPLEKAEYEDRNFEFDKTYYYAVRTIGSLQNPRAESLPSKTIEVPARDTFPPSPPRDLQALPDGVNIVLLWSRSLAAYVEGYRVYRQEKGSADRRLLQDKLVSAWSFRDNRITPGKSYEYRVTAVDFHNNESDAAVATIEIP